MASVAFIIRVPFEENRENLRKGEGNNKPENLKENKEECLSWRNNDENSGKNIKEVTFEENHNTSVGDKVEPRDETDEEDQAKNDLETLTDLNLAEVLSLISERALTSIEY